MEGEVDVTEETIQGHEFMITTDGCFLPQPAENAPDVEVSLEDQLKSTEKLDRSSPDLWPTNRKHFKEAIQSGIAGSHHFPSTI